MNQIQIYHRAIKINEEEHEDNRTSTEEDQIDEVTFGDTFDTNKIKRRSDHEGRNNEENSEKMKKDDTEKKEFFLTTI